MSNLPRRSIEDHVAYEVVCNAEPSVRFRVIAESETAAKVQALDKIGFNVLVDDGSFILVDADDNADVLCALNVHTLDHAFNAAFKHIGWSFKEPTQMIGGALGEGFGEVDDE